MPLGQAHVASRAKFTYEPENQRPIAAMERRRPDVAVNSPAPFGPLASLSLNAT
jgi:hypothetical protein